jgi:hypothetical protein
MPDGGRTRDDLQPVRGVLVGCGQQKRDERALAKELYTSNYFQLKREHAEKHADVWRIVSAEHGLVHPNRPLDPYDTALEDLSDDERNEWRREVATDLNELHLEEDVDRWTVLAGGEYLRELDMITSRIRIVDSYAPTAGMEIGKRMEYLAAEVDGKDPEEVMTVD